MTTLTAEPLLAATSRTTLSSAVRSSSWRGVVVGSLSGALIGTAWVPVWATLAGLVVGAIGGLVIGTLSGFGLGLVVRLGPKFATMAGLLIAAAAAALAMPSFMLLTGGGEPGQFRLVFVQLLALSLWAALATLNDAIGSPRRAVLNQVVFWLAVLIAVITTGWFNHLNWTADPDAGFFRLP